MRNRREFLCPECQNLVWVILSTGRLAPHGVHDKCPASGRWVQKAKDVPPAPVAKKAAAVKSKNQPPRITVVGGGLPGHGKNR